MKVFSAGAGDTTTPAIDTMCFEAMYFGVGYAPAKGAQKWRSSMGPMFGILSNLIWACTFPTGTSIKGKLTLALKDGSTKEINDNFFWIIVSMRSPFNGRLTEDLWVSYMTLEQFPGFGRMMDYFSPPMELFLGCATVMQEHYNVTKFEWHQDAECGPIGVCLDGDAMDGSQNITVELAESAWMTMASQEYPSECVHEVKDGVLEAKPLTACAKAWLTKNDPDKKLPLPQVPGYNFEPPKREGCCS